MYPKIKTKDILTLAWPEFATQIIIVCTTMIEMFNVAKIGVVAVAALSIGNIILMMVNNFLGEVEMGSRVLSARFHGAKDEKSISQTFVASIIVSASLGCLVVLLSSFISFVAFYLVGDPSVNQIGTIYLSTILKSVPFSLLFFALIGFITGTGDTLSPFLIRFVMHLFEVCLEYTLIFGAFGFPRLGVFGVAIAAIYTYLFGVMMCLAIIFFKKLVRIKVSTSLLKTLVTNNFSVLKDYLELSFDLGTQFGLSDIAMYLFVLIIGWHGVNALAIHQIAYYQILSSLIFPIYSFYIVATVFIGQIIGAQKIVDVVPTAQRILTIAMIFSTISAISIFICSSVIGNIFSPLDKQIAVSAATAIKILCLNVVFETYYTVISGCLIGASESRFVMGAGLFVEYLVLLPLGYLLSWVFGLGINGAYIALCLRSLANCFIVGRQFFSVKSWERSQPIMPAIQQKVVPNSKAVPGWIFKQDKSQND